MQGPDYSLSEGDRVRIVNKTTAKELRKQAKETGEPASVTVEVTKGTVRFGHEESRVQSGRAYSQPTSGKLYPRGQEMYAYAETDCTFTVNTSGFLFDLFSEPKVERPKDTASRNRQINDFGSTNTASTGGSLDTIVGATVGADEEWNVEAVSWHARQALTADEANAIAVSVVIEDGSNNPQVVQNVPYTIGMYPFDPSVVADSGWQIGVAARNYNGASVDMGATIYYWED